jgi:chemotaxis protein CheD
MATPTAPEIYLKPGEYFLGDQPVLVHTVLGSCVAVSMFHRHSRLAALCHAVQPDCGTTGACQNRCAHPYRYITCMIPAMIRAFCSRQIHPADIEVKLFGGATMIGHPDGRQRQPAVGAMNLAAARKIIKARGLHLQAADVGGPLGRKIIFDTRAGVVMVKRMQKIPPALTDNGVPVPCPPAY